MDINLVMLQDTTTNTKVLKGNLNTVTPELNLSRNTITLGELRNVQIDSARIVQAAPKPRPVVKTIPWVPLNDSIEHPEYSVLDGKMLFPKAQKKESDFSFWKILPAVQVSKTEKKKTARTEQVSVVNQDSSFSKVRSKSIGNTDWMLGVLIFLLILFGWVRLRFGRFVSLVIRSSYNFFVARRINEEGNVVRSRVFYALNIGFFVVGGLFLSQYIQYRQWDVLGLSGFPLLGVNVILLIILYGLKSAFLGILDYVFLAQGAINSYITTIFIYNKMLAFFLLPVVCVIPFVGIEVVEILFYLGFALAGIMYLGRIFRGFQIAFKNRLSILYMFLYLCALEILPLMLIYKMLKLLV